MEAGDTALTAAVVRSTDRTTIAALRRIHRRRVVVDCSEIEVERMIATLQGSEFIYERPAFPAVEHVFKHALTQEVAYNSLLLERRKLLHERTAQALEALFVDAIDDHLVDLSYHYSRSGNDSRALGRAEGDAAVSLFR